MSTGPLRPRFHFQAEPSPATFTNRPALSSRTVTANRFSLHSNKINFCFASNGKGLAVLIPLRHENMEGRRWPAVTFVLIALKVLVFLGTHWRMDAQTPERAEVRMHIILLAAMHP